MVKKILGYYQNMSIGMKASFWFMLCNIVQKGISMLTVPIFTRLLTPSEYGIYSVYQSWYNLLIMITTLSLYEGVFNKGMVKYEDRRDYFTSSLQGLSCLITFAFAILYLLNMPFWDNILDLSPFYMIVMFATMFCTPAYLYWSARQRFEYKYKALFVATCIVALLSPILGVALILMTNQGAKALVFAFAIVQIGTGIFFLWQNWHRGRKIVDIEIWDYALRFNLPLIPHNLSTIILSQADRIMISKIVGSAQAAIYSVAYNISLIMSLITTAINSTFVPNLYYCLKNKEYDKARKNGNFVILCSALLTAVAMLFGPELIRIFAPASYYEAIWVMPPVSLSVFFIMVYKLYVNIEMYFEKTNFVMYASIAVAILNIALNWFFISAFGYLAAGYTTLFCYIAFSVAHYYFYRKVNKEFMDNSHTVDNRYIVAVSALLLAWMAIVLFLYNMTLIRWIIIVAIFVVAVLNVKKISRFITQGMKA